MGTNAASRHRDGEPCVDLVLTDPAHVLHQPLGLETGCAWGHDERLLERVAFGAFEAFGDRLVA
jgi:hypothetical protein